MLLSLFLTYHVPSPLTKQKQHNTLRSEPLRMGKRATKECVSSLEKLGTCLDVESKMIKEINTPRKQLQIKMTQIQIGFKRKN